MDIWYDNFLWIFIFMLAAGWYIPKLFWYSNYNISKKVFICFLFSIMSMVFAAGILALLTFCLEYGIYVMANAFFKDVSSSLILYFEVGGETTAGWFIAIFSLNYIARWDAIDVEPKNFNNAYLNWLRKRLSNLN